MSPGGADRWFSDHAEQFDELYGRRGRLSTWLRRSMRLRFEAALEACRPAAGKRVLDVGCGPGLHSVALAKEGAHVVGVDFAEGMLARATDRARRSGVEGTCRFVLGDFMTLPIEGRFDHVIGLGLMDYVADPASMLRRMLSLASRSVVLSFPADGGFLAWQRKLRYRFRCPLYLYSRDRLEELLAGLPARADVRRVHRDFFVTLTPLPTR